ncbi:MAG: glycosyl hydrolase [Solirubrobacterales bacterium]
MALLAVVALSLLGPAPAGAVRSEFYGIVQGATLDGHDLKGLQKARVRTDRFLLNWGWVQPTGAGSFDWSGPDRLIGGLAAHGMRAVPAIWGNPGWVFGAPALPPLARPKDVLAWRTFLKAAVARYGPDGAYWKAPYHNQHGAHATPLPIQSWQIWNEPNLKKYFAPQPSPPKYAQLLKVSHDAIKSADRNAQIVLAGMPGYGDINAWDYLSRLYSVGGVKPYFDDAAVHPYGRTVEQSSQEIKKVRTVMSAHDDQDTPLWITEIGWGSAPPDHFGINQGPQGQQKLLGGAFKLILSHRREWNIGRLFWFHWRDPQSPRPGTCSFCGSAGLLAHNRAPKPAMATFKSFTADFNPPTVSIWSGPRQGTTIRNATPIFRLRSSEPGSTFKCGFGPQALAPCSSPVTPPERLADGTHKFVVRAIDAAGNLSPALVRSFTVDTAAPKARITSGPGNGVTTSNDSPIFKFTANESPVKLQCQLDGGGMAACSSPHSVGPLADGQHSFQVVATDRAGNVGPVASRTWTIDTSAQAGSASASEPAN